MNIKKWSTLLLLVSLSAFVFAQEGPRRPPGSMMDRLQNELELTDEQVAGMKAVYQKYQAEKRAVWQNTALTVEEQKAQLDAIRSQEEEEIAKLLNAEQLEKWNGLKAKGRTMAVERRQANQQRMRDRRHLLSEEMKEKLQLSDEQVTAWEDLNQRYSEEIRAIAQDGSLTRDEQKMKIAALQAQKEEELSTILSPEQLEQWKANKEEARSQFRNRDGRRRRQGGGR